MRGPKLMFRVLGVCLLLYVASALASGKVYAKSGWRGRMVSRAESPDYFVVVIVIYTALGVALLTVF